MCGYSYRKRERVREAVKLSLIHIFDLADAVFGSFSDHGLRHTLRARDIAAVLIAFIDEFLENRRGSMQHERSVRDQLVDGFETFKVQIRLTLEFVRAVASADGNRQRVYAGSFDEFRGLIPVSYTHLDDLCTGCAATGQRQQHYRQRGKRTQS